MTKEEIKENVSIYDICDRYDIPYRKRLIACPFHNDTHPSCTISRDGKSFYCFACGAKGDIFDLVMKLEGVDFKEAFRLLGGKGNSNFDKEKFERRKMIKRANLVLATLHLTFIQMLIDEDTAIVDSIYRYLLKKYPALEDRGPFDLTLEEIVKSGKYKVSSDVVFYATESMKVSKEEDIYKEVDEFYKKRKIYAHPKPLRVKELMLEYEQLSKKGAGNIRDLELLVDRYSTKQVSKVKII